MADKYLKIGTTGLREEVEGKVTSAGAGDAGKIPALDASGVFDPTLFPPGFGSNTSLIVASEALATGDFVNVWDDTGTVKVRKADNSNARRAHGFVLAGVSAAANATVYGPGELNNQRSGLTLGGNYLLGVTGGVTLTAPASTGNYVQSLGVAESATAIRFNPGDVVVRA